MRDAKGRLIYVTPEHRCSTIRCGGLATAACAHPLRGKLEGRTCDAAICASCTKDGLCPSHRRHVQRRNSL